MLNTILIDSGPLIALFDRDDLYHTRIIEFIKGKKYKFISTIAVLTEVSHMLDFNINAQIDFLKCMKRKIISRFISLEEKQRYPSFKNTVEYYVDKGQEHQLMTTILSQMLNEGLIIQEIRQCNISRIIELTKKYSDRPMDFADATLVVAAEITGIKQILSIDSDFDIYRLPGKEMIENVFL